MDNDYRDAGCVILYRTGADGLRQVFLARRNPTLSFLGGFDAFPGGTVEKIDRQASRKPDDSYRLAAARELLEETGVWVLTGPAPSVSDFAWELSDDDHQTVADWHQVGEWITPPFLPVNFRARYFAVPCPPDQEPSLDADGELVDGYWYQPERAIRAHERGDLLISYPVLETLRAIAKTDDWQAAHSAVEARPNVDVPGGEMVHGVHLIPLRTFTLPPATHTNCYVLGDLELVVVDPASPFPEEQAHLEGYLRYLVGKGATVKEVWLSHQHGDHIGGVEAICDSFGVGLAAHPLTAEHLPGLKFDRFLHDNQVETLKTHSGGMQSWTILHTPGHAYGHLCFFESSQKILLSGDNVLGLGSVLVAPPEGDMVQYLDSLRRMQDLDAAVMFPAHGPPTATVHQKIQSYIDHRLGREAAILDAIEAGINELQGMTEKVYEHAPGANLTLAILNVQAHTDKLVHEGRVRLGDDGTYSIGG